MNAFDKAKNKAEELAAKGKEALGDALNDDGLRAEGEAEQAKAKAKQAGENIKDAGKKLTGD